MGLGRGCPNPVGRVQGWVGVGPGWGWGWEWEMGVGSWDGSGMGVGLGLGLGGWGCLGWGNVNLSTIVESPRPLHHIESNCFLQAAVGYILVAAG